MKNVARICFLTLLWLSFVAPVAAQEKPATNVFVFNGGQLRDFVNEIRIQLGFDLHAQATLDTRHEFSIAVPRMSMPAGDWRTVLRGYNYLSMQTGLSLGKWVTAIGGRDGVDAILFDPPPPGAQQSIQVRAFSFDFQGKASAKEHAELVRHAIHEEAQIMRGNSSAEETRFSGKTRFNEATGLLLVSGGPGYIELATTMIEAYREQQKLKHLP
jgi:hypothetical protein